MKHFIATCSYSSSGYLFDCHAALPQSSVRMSADGNAIAVGAFADSNFDGADFVFRRAAGAAQWVYDQRVRAVGAPAGASVSFGNVMSADGNTIVQPAGTAPTLYVLAIATGQAPMQTQAIVLPGAGGGAVRLSQDASTLVSTALDTASNNMRLHVFTRTSRTAQYAEQAVLSPSTATASFQSAFAIDASGSRLAVLLQDVAALQLPLRFYLRVGAQQEWQLQPFTSLAVPAPRQLSAPAGTFHAVYFDMSRDGSRVAVALPAEMPTLSLTYEAALEQVTSEEHDSGQQPADAHPNSSADGHSTTSIRQCTALVEAHT
jgi:hypothetical protein